MIQIVNSAMQIPDNERVIGVQGDNLAQKRVFTINKVVNGLDLSTYTPLMQLQAIYPTHPPYFDILTTSISGDSLILTWNISSHDMNSKGNLYFQIQFSKALGSDVIVYQTLKDLFVVAPTIEARAEYENMTPAVFEQYIKRAKAEADRAESIASGLTGRVDVAINNANTQAAFTKGVGDDLNRRLAAGEFKGEKGDGLNLAGSKNTLAELNAAFPNGDGVNTYLIGTDVYVWNGTAWINGGRFQGKSAYEQAVSGGYTGTEVLFIAELNDIASEQTLTAHTSDLSLHVTTLTHTKTATAHNLVGTLPTTGIVSANFLATADGNENDTISVNSQPYAIKDTLGNPISGFKTGIAVPILINIDSKTITMGGGGGMGKMVQQLELPMSLVYEETSSEKTWGTMDVLGQPAMGHSCVENGIIYSLQRTTIDGAVKWVLYEQNYFTKVVTIKKFADAAIHSYYKTLRYMNETYVVGYTSQSTNTSVTLYKLNGETLTVTTIKQLGNDRRVSDGSCYETIFHVTEDLIVRISIHNSRSTANVYCYWYSFSQNNTPQIINTLSDIAMTPGAVPYLLQNDFKSRSSRFLVPNIVYAGNVESCLICQFSWETKAFSVQYDKAELKGLASRATDGVQVADKMMYITDMPLFAGKKTGEIDLYIYKLEPLKYPDIPNNINSNYNNVHLIGDEVIAQNTGKTYSLKLIPVPPQNKPLYMKLFKGDKYSAPFASKDISVLPLTSPTQPAFTITRMQQTATQDLEIHDCQYDLQGSPTQLLVEKG